ncbi:YesL family protein, partial [Erysipelatoclostridium ramosum]|nr:YesL family protein [Thomasclavelia ramosa]
MLSVAWFVCCLPVVTIGVSTAAACEVAREMQED